MKNLEYRNLAIGLGTAMTNFSGTPAQEKEGTGVRGN